jgi:uncharacterized SAM-binding protein YcdF (DUF218 family)
VFRLHGSRLLSLLRQLLAASLVLLVLGFLLAAHQIARYAENEFHGSADAAVILGAAAWGSKPSPVYRERINEGLRLYAQGRVAKLIFTGGTRELGFPSEAEVARQFAIHRGIPAQAILLDTESRTTLQNLTNAKVIMQTNGIRSVLLVSDPLHMKRVMAIAEDMGLDAHPAPTESSRFQSLPARGRFLWRETWLYLEHLLLGGVLSKSNGS